MKKREIAILIKHRIEQARTALDDAEFLIKGNRSSQSIVNRAYYAMFYAVLALLQKSGKVPSRHTGAIGLFDTEYVRIGVLPKDLSKNLHKAFELRQTSDYRSIERLSPEKAVETWRNAVQFVEAVERHLVSEGSMEADKES
jgi:uncharacterized protein (UPF0332 family)